MILEVHGEQRVIGVGEGFDIPAGISHSARTGEEDVHILLGSDYETF